MCIALHALYDSDSIPQVGMYLEIVGRDKNKTSVFTWFVTTLSQRNCARSLKLNLALQEFDNKIAPHPDSNYLDVDRSLPSGTIGIIVQHGLCAIFAWN